MNPSRATLCAAMLAVLTACGSGGQPAAEQTAHGVILFIGDGMGDGPRTAARLIKAGPSGRLAMDAMPVSGWSRTLNALGEVTDSAAGATAIATGHKTVNGAIGMDAQLNRLPTLLEDARARGKAVGLVTTTDLTDATPAAFAAHVPSRALSDQIALQLSEAGIDLLLAGGENRFLPPSETGCYPSPGARADTRNLIAEAQARGYRYLCQPDALPQVIPAATPRLLGLFADGAMPRPVQPSLAAMTRKAIAILSQDPEGFFLVVEGGLIDKAGHGHDAATMIQDVLDLDEAVQVATETAAAAPDLLIVVAADHDTGGVEVVSAGGEQGPFQMPDGTPFYVNFTAAGHTARDVPVTATGPSAEAFKGTFENTHIHDAIARALQ